MIAGNDSTIQNNMVICSPSHANEWFLFKRPALNWSRVLGMQQDNCNHFDKIEDELEAAKQVETGMLPSLPYQALCDRPLVSDDDYPVAAAYC